MKISSIIVSMFLSLAIGNSYAEEVNYREFLKLNSTNIAKVSMGMSENDVKGIMGDYTTVKGTVLNNPWKIERSGDAAVYHYLTSKHPPFTPIVEHQATPVLIKDGKVIGIGRGFLKDFRNNAMVSKSAVPASAPATEKSIEERMATLKNLLDSGAIDKATYEVQKQKILDDI